jgi:cytochrome P450 family 26 subfamily A
MKSYLHQEGDEAFFNLVQVFKTHLLFSPAVSLGAPEGNKFLFSNEYKLVQGSWPLSATTLFGRGSILSKTGKEHK